MSTAKRLHYSYEDYLVMLRDSELKLEYCDGVVYAMAGGTPAHAALAASMLALLRQAVFGRCLAYTSDLKVRVESTGLATFPDGSIVCGELQTAAIDRNAVINPTILIEVTSRSTEDYDRGDKLSHYKQLPSLRAVLIVSHRVPCVTVIAREPNGWSELEARAGEVVTLHSPALTLRVDELYQGIALDPA